MSMSQEGFNDILLKIEKINIETESIKKNIESMQNLVKNNFININDSWPDHEETVIVKNMKGNVLICIFFETKKYPNKINFNNYRIADYLIKDDYYFYLREFIISNSPTNIIIKGVTHWMRIEKNTIIL